MVSLPSIRSYKDKQREEFLKYSPLFSHYLKLVDKNPETFSDKLRIKRQTHWLECAFATLANNESSENICLYWTQKTEEILKQAWEESQIHKLDVSLIALGKLGSKELNLSSDIDVIFVRGNESDIQTINPAIKNFIQLINSVTPFGFAYRVDTSLRPGGDMSPLVPSLSHFYNYFDEYTEAWHRLSFLRLRPTLGPQVLQKKVDDYCQRLAFPRRLDFSVIEEIKNIRLKLSYQWKKASEPLDLKFHPGGIRDIELYIQALQVIYGGRHPSLKTHSMSLAMQELKQQAIISKEEFNFLNSFYWQLRTIENHIHIYEDKHTYVLKPDIVNKIPHITQLASLEKDFQKSIEIMDGFFLEPPQEREDFSKKMENYSERTQKHIQEIINLKSHSLKKTQNEKRKTSILDKFLADVHTIAFDKELAIETFRDFINSIKSKSSIFHLLDRHPELLENLAWLFSVSPYAGQILCRRPELIDSFVLGSVEISMDSPVEEFLENLVDYKFLGQLVSIIYFLKNDNVNEFNLQLTDHAHFIVGQLYQFLQKTMPCEDIEILCMGKWAGRELGVQSDLDFVFLCDSSPTPGQIKLARRFVNLLVTPTKTGKLYNIDLRLKPNESSMPLLIEKNQVYSFIKEKGKGWQKQAYLRSRLLNQDNPFFKDHFDHLWLNPNDIHEIDEIHKKLIKPTTSLAIDVKVCQGGLLDTELRLQKVCLLQKVQPETPSTAHILQSLHLDLNLKTRILNNYLELRKFEQVFQISNHSPSTKVSESSANTPRMEKLLGYSPVFERLKSIMKDQTEILKDLT